MTIELTQLLYTAVLGVALPSLVALVTDRFAAGWVKECTLLFLSVLASAVTELQASGGFSVRDFGIKLVLTYTAAVTAHFRLLKPAGVTGSDGVIAMNIPGGIGTTGQFGARHRYDQ